MGDSSPGHVLLMVEHRQAPLWSLLVLPTPHYQSKSHIQAQGQKVGKIQFTYMRAMQGKE